MRQFATGASRSSEEGKPQYAGYLSPVVIRAYGRYMLRHQTCEDGSLRASDNWKAGMPKRVYLESLLRHMVDAWECVTEDAETSTRTDGEKLEEALCAILFNASGMLREIILDRGEKS